MDRPSGKSSLWQARRPTTRRLVQLYAALLHNAYLKGFIDGKIYEGNAKALCVPGLNCYSCPGAVGACPLGALQNALSASGHRAPWYIFGMLLLFGVVLGRTVCGWLCPFGLIQELLHRIPTPKIRKSRFTRLLSWLKYVILAVFVFVIPLYFGLLKDLPLPAFCKYICPAGTLEGAAGHLANSQNRTMFDLLGTLFTNKWIILMMIILLCVFVYRFFCRFFCPLGALYGLFSRFALVGVKVDPDRCSGCGACVSHCPMDVRRVGDRECIHCGKCMDRCSSGAISVKAGKAVLKAPVPRSIPSGTRDSGREKKTARLLWAAALFVLVFAFAWFNFFDPSVRNQADVLSAPAGALEPVSSAPVGFNVGERLADFSVDCYDGSVFTLSDHLGKVVVINRWATWCTPCINELPYFNDLYLAHRDDLEMIVVHPSLVVDDPEAFISSCGYEMPFATDSEGDPVREIVGGTGTLPQTVVLNRRGEVIWNSEKSVTPELLEALFLQASE